MECPACHHANIDGARFCAKCGAPLPSALSEEDPLIGSIVGGRYRITAILGEGGMGRVYTAEQQMGSTVRKAAVKTLLAQYAKDPQVLARFNRECGTVAELKHPNTIQVWDFGQTNTGELYIAMELLEGKSLEDALIETGPMPADRVDRIIGQAAGSLQEAHNKGIVHRDLKPANIFLTKLDGDNADFVKVLDFGIAKRSERPDSKEQKLTQQGTVLGTPPYMSPEQFRGQELDMRSDVYSLAVVAYEMLTGRLPFDADTPWAWATQHLTAQPFPFEVTPLGAQAPPKMKAAIMRALEKDKNKRQSTIREFYEELSIGGARGSVTGQQAAQAPGTAAMPGYPSGPMPGYPSGPMPGYPSAQMPGYPSAQMPSRAGGTQMGEPMFAQGAPPSPGGRTMVDTGQASAMSVTPQPMPVMHMPPHGGMQSGPAYPQPPPPRMGGRQQQSSMLPIVAGVGILGVLGIGIAVFALGGKSSGGDGDAIILPGSAPTTVVIASDQAPSSAGSSGAGTAPSATTGGTTGSTTGGSGTTGGTGTGAGATTAGPKVDPAADKACDAAIQLALGGNTSLAIGQYRSCTGPKRSKALSAIDGSAAREVRAKGCAAKGVADSAASLGASTGKGLLPAKCK